ncbi:hypothetical protein ACET3Z_031766 [Daucus carota]
MSEIQKERVGQRSPVYVVSHHHMIKGLMTWLRENEHATIQVYGDMVEARGVMMTELKKVIEANPVFNDKLVFPSLRSSRLPALINQSLNWQHHLCGNHRPYPDNIKTLYTDNHPQMMTSHHNSRFDSLLYL